MMGGCGTYAWFPVDVVRSHYQIMHTGYPQFFIHHRRFLDQMESWIVGRPWTPGWLDDLSRGGNSTYNQSGATMFPFGHFPYWDSGTAVPNNGHSPGNNFLYTPLPGGATWSSNGTDRNCHTGTQCPGGNGTGCDRHANPVYGIQGRVDTGAAAPAGNCPTNGCDWEASQSFGNPNYTRTYPEDILCTANNSDFMFGTVACDTSCANTASNQGFTCFHGCVHEKLSGVSEIYLGNVVYHYFGSYDSPAVPLFFPWHAWVDHYYGKRLDCYGTGP